MAKTSTITVKILGDAKNAISEIDSFTGKLGKIGGIAAAGATALGGLAVAGGAALFAVGQAFDEAENNIIRGTGATGDALEALTEEMKDVLATVPETADVVSTALADVNTFFGQTGDQLETSTRSFLDFARVTETDLNTAISATDALFTQFGEDAGNLDETLGDLTRISQATGAGMDGLLSQLETFGPIFANAGFSIEETASVFGQLEQAGVDVTRIGPALNKFLRDAADAGEDGRAALTEQVAAIRDAESATEALNIASDAFGAEGAQRLTNAIRSGNFDLQDFNDLLGEGAGLVGEQADATASFADKWNEVKNGVLVGLEPLATTVFDGVISAMESLSPHIEDFSVWFAETVPEAIETARPYVEDVIEWFEDNVPPAVDALMGAVETVSDWFGDTFPESGESANETLEAISGYFEAATEFWTAVWEKWGDEILAVVEILGDFLGPYLTAMFDGLTAIFETFTALIEGDWSGVWNGLSGIVSAALTAVQLSVTAGLDIIDGLASSAATNIVEGISSAWDSLVEGVSGLGGRITSAASGMFDGVADAFRDAINVVIDGWNSLSFSVPSVDLGPVGSFGGQTIGTPDLPRLAQGGAVFGPTLAIVGDNPGARTDPEIAAPQSYIEDAVRRVLDEDGRQPIVVNIDTYSTTRTIEQGINDLIGARA